MGSRERRRAERSNGLRKQKAAGGRRLVGGDSFKKK